MKKYIILLLVLIFCFSINTEASATSFTSNTNQEMTFGSNVPGGGNKSKFKKNQCRKQKRELGRRQKKPGRGRRN